MQKEKQVVIEQMDVTLSKVTVRREGGKDEPKRAMAYMTFGTVLTEKMLADFGLSDIARDPRFQMGEDIVLSQMKQGLHGNIDLIVCVIEPVTGEVKPIVESPGMLTKMTLTGEVFGIEVSYPLNDDADWNVFGDMFTHSIERAMKVTAKPDNRGAQEPLIDKVIGRVLCDAPAELGKSMDEGDSMTLSTPGKEPVVVKGKKKVKR